MVVMMIDDDDDGVCVCVCVCVCMCVYISVCLNTQYTEKIKQSIKSSYLQRA